MNTPPYHIRSRLRDVRLDNHQVILRVDCNVPLDHATILDDYRLTQLQETLDYLKKEQAQVLLIGHLGRPHGRDRNLSLQPVVDWFTAHGYDAVLADGIPGARALLKKHPLVVLENIRFWPEELTNDKNFAQQLKELAPFYINDAFGTLHRTDTSLLALANAYAPEERTIGFLVERELSMLNQLIEKPKHPYVVFIGGSKLTTKLPLISELIKKADMIALLPAIANTIAQYQGLSIGTSLVDTQATQSVAVLLEQARKLHKEIIIPEDYLVSLGNFTGPFTYVGAHEVQENHMIISIGPRTLERYQHLIATAQTIFINGIAGDARYPETLNEMRTLLQTLCPSRAFRVVGGGDSVGIIHQLKLMHCADWCSTGGGATLQYLSGQPLPALAPFVAP